MKTITETPSQASAEPRAAKRAAVRAVAEQAARMAAVLEANPELLDDPEMAAELAGIAPPMTTAADEWPEASQSIEWETWPAPTATQA